MRSPLTYRGARRNIVRAAGDIGLWPNMGHHAITHRVWKWFQDTSVFGIPVGEPYQRQEQRRQIVHVTYVKALQGAR